MSGLAAGAVAYFLTFNHDTGRFEIFASGTVSTEGDTITTDPGSGLTLAGWGCSCPPYSVTAECEGCVDAEDTEPRVAVCATTPKFVLPIPGLCSAPLSHLNISNFRTTQNLGDATEAAQDLDNFALEVLDKSVPRDQSEITVQLESLRPDQSSFDPPRRMDVSLSRVGRSKVFRSKYLRLVVDEADDGAAGGGAEVFADQTLLVSTDPNDGSLEILGQIVRATYGGCTADVPVGYSPKSIDIRVHILSDIPESGSDGSVAWTLTPQIVQRAIETHVRRIYAQANIGLGQITVLLRAPVNNVVAVSHIHGRAAFGGGLLSFQVEAQRSTGQVVWIVDYPTLADFTPLETAQEIAQVIAGLDPVQGGTAGDRLQVQVFENPLLAGEAGHSADLFIQDPAGGTISVTVSSSFDLLQDIIAPVARGDLVVGDRWTGSVEERALNYNYGSSGNVIDVFVANDLVD
ncbi:MAG TPA: hypothetical protein P5307_27165, partial [Pirellulaceae bacterium]|nr:hypothetical protein [Pirellulaceae bacterium]